MAQWLVTNLEPAEDDGSVKFSFDINAITMLFEDFCNLDLWSFLYEFARYILISRYVALFQLD